MKRRNPSLTRYERQDLLVAESGAKQLAYKFALGEDSYSKALVGHLIGRVIVIPEIGRISVLDDGQVAVVFSNGEHMLFGTFDSMTMWLGYVADKSGMNPAERKAWIKLADSMITFSVEYAKKLSMALPAPKETIQGAPLKPGTQEPVGDVEFYLGGSTLEEIENYENESSILCIALDIAETYPLDWSFEKIKYQPDQFDVHGFKDYHGDERLDFIRILKTGPRKPGEAEADAILTCGKPGNKNEDMVPHVLRYNVDGLGNQFVWFYNTMMCMPLWDSETFDDEYLEKLQKMVPDPALQDRLILEYDISWANPGSYYASEVGWLGLIVAALMLDGTTGVFRPEPSLVFDPPGKSNARQIFDSVCKFNNLTFDNRLTQFSPGSVFYSHYEWEERGSPRQNKPKRRK